ncbi:MAG: D-alanine--D-alanine ligase [Pseudomonadaceae bacterium]|nr:D-alanine--D-alanine ligase [Pseudomonadaceae bacterium]
MRVAVLQGGSSAEAEVSRSSAREVCLALNESGFEAFCVELDEQLTQNLLAQKPDVVFPALHGPPGEDGTVQGYLEMLEFAYVGGDVASSAFAMHKAAAKLLFADAGLPVARGLSIKDTADIDACIEAIRTTLGERVVIKPQASGSALGVTLLPNGGDVRTALQDALAFGEVLVEPFISGREITCGVLDLHGEEAIAHPVIEITTDDNEWYDFTNRYAAGKSKHILPAPLEQNVLDNIADISLRAHACLGLRDLSRADFIVNDLDEVVLLEVNSLPGMTPTSLYPDGAAALGYSFPELVSALVTSAAQRSKQFSSA